jgi:hypothetical protein
MRLFSKRAQQGYEHPKEEPDDIAKAIALISARQTFLEALTSQLVAELPPKKRDNLLQQLREVVRGLTLLPPPIHMQSHREQDFYDELRRVMQILIEKTKSFGTAR